MFELLMKSYKNMNESGKRIALITELKKLITILQNVCEEKNIPFRKIDSKEISELDNGNESIDDYLEALFAYIMYLEELVTSYIEITLE